MRRDRAVSRMHARITFLLLLACCWLESLQGFRGCLRWIERRSVALQSGEPPPVVPYFIDRARREYQWMDIFNVLGRERSLFVGRYIDNEAANQLIAALVWLQSQSQDPVTMYINSPGAMIHPVLAIYDTIAKLSCPVRTVNIGLTVGMSALLCAAGSAGQRYCLPNARFLMGKAGADDLIEGTAAQLAVDVGEIAKRNRRAVTELAKRCALSPQKLEKDLLRDFYLTAPEAVAYGVVDHVLLPPQVRAWSPEPRSFCAHFFPLSHPRAVLRPHSSVPQPVKVMKFRGMDDATIGFGHFAEMRQVSADDTAANSGSSGTLPLSIKKPAYKISVRTH